MNALTRFFASVFSGWFDKRLWSTIGTSRTTTAKVEVSEESALNYAAVWCATKLLCGTGAQLPLPVYQSDDGESRKKLRDHPVYRLLNIAPNPEQTAFNFRSVMWQWQVNWGNAFAEIVREGGVPGAPVTELWPIHPSRVTIDRYDDNELYYEVHEVAGEPTILPASRMLHLPSIITYDGTVGRGVIQHARETIGAGIAAEMKAAMWFGGASVPALAIEHPGRWNDEARASFRKEWKEIYGGPTGDQVAILQGGATAKPLLGFSATDSQFIESRQFDIEEVARWYGVPPHLLQHLMRATFNNVEELGIDFVRYGLVSWLEIWEQAIRQKLFSERERDSLFAEHSVDALLRGNAVARSELYKAMTGSAIMSRNECRKLENLDPVDGGDTFLVQGAMVPLDSEGKPESEFVAGAARQRGPPSTNGNGANHKAASSVRKIIQGDLSRMLTKESKAMESYAKKPEKFVDSVDSFYFLHRSTLIDVLSPTADALIACGTEFDKMTTVATWIDEGKALMLEAAGAASPKELPAAVSSTIQSQTWAGRPERASNATAIV